MSLNDQLQTIHGLYQAGRMADAVNSANSALMAYPGDANLLHLKAVVLRRMGDLAGAIAAMRQAAVRAPSNHELQNTLGNMLKAADGMAEAETAFRRSIELKPDYAPAYKNLVTLLLDENRSDDAIPVAENYRSQTDSSDPDAFECLGRARKQAKAWKAAQADFQECVKLSPKHVAGRYGLASCLVETGDLKASEKLCRELRSEGQTAPQILRLHARVLMEQLRLEEAEPPLKQAIAAGSADALKDFTNLLWMTKRNSEANQTLEGALMASRERPAQALTALDEWLDMEAPDKVVAQFDRLQPEQKQHPLFAIRLSMAKDDLGEVETAYQLAEQAHAELPAHRIVAYQYIVASLMSGRYDRALEVVRTWRAKQPQDQDWVALEADALRMLGQAEAFHTLYDFDRFVKPAQLPVPDGYRSLEDFHADFIEQVHGRSPYKTHPLGQSARQGIQSPLNLLFDDRPVVQSYIRALHEPVQDFVSQMGRDPANPMTARNQGEFFIGGVWSIFLLAGGRHVSHTHPNGWVSSAYYMAVPPEADTDPNRAGWIKFGEPPYKLPDEAPALHWVKPTPGTLVLFPAYMWHGTVPISGAAPRVTAPLDILPGAAL